MRGLVLLLAMVSLTGCVRRTANPFQGMRQRLAAVVHSGAIKVKVKVDANAAVAAASQPPPPPPVRTEAPAVRTEAPPARPRPHATTPPPAELPVHRVDAARRTVFVLRGQTKAGAGVCEPYETSDACTSACTAKLRPAMVAAPSPSSVTSCACLEQDSGC